MAATPKKNSSKERPYTIFSRHRLKSPSDLQKLLEPQKNNFPAEILVIVGREASNTPEKALAAHAERKDLGGEFEVAADSAFVKMPVEVEHTKRAKVGKPKK
jgi:hypothetical protein